MELFRLVQGGLAPSEAARVAEHVAGCARCTAQVGSYGGASSIRVGAGLADLLEPRTEDASPATGPSAVDGADAATRVVGRPPSVPRPRAGDSRPPYADPTRHIAAGTRRPRGDEDATTDEGAGDSSSFSARSPSIGEALPQGTIIGRYIIIAPLGSGGLGDVYTAYDPELDRRVAVKLLRPSIGDSGDGGAGSGRDRLIREAKAMARLSHPNVVAVYDVGHIGNEVFIAMERIEGVTLSAWLREQARPWTQVRDVFVEAGRGLAAAHDAGIVHRDFKPTNVIVGDDGRPRVLDFGLARSVEKDARQEATRLPRSDIALTDVSLDDPVTMPGTVMGTPHFMAPEQFRGADQAGPASDQFGFCTALWLALYRQPPFAGADAKQLVDAIDHARFTEPLDRRGVPAWLQKVLVRGLSHDPERRHRSMHALLHALRRDYRSRRRNWLGLAVVAVLSGSGAAAAAFFIRPPVDAAQRDAIDVLSEEARAAAARSYFVYPAPDDPETTTAYRKVLEIEARDGPERELAAERAVALRAEFAETLVRLGDRYYEREGGRAFAADYYAAALIFDPDDEHSRSRTTLTPGELGALREKAASGEFSEGELVAAASLQVLALEDEAERVKRWEALFAGDNAPSEGTIARLGALLGEQETEVIEQASQTKRRKRKRPPSEPEPEPEKEAAVATPAPLSGEAAPDTTDAEAELVAPDPPAAPKKDPGAANALAKAGLDAFRAGRFDEAEGLFHRALARDSRNATALGGLAELYFEQGSYPKAVKFGARVVAVAPKSARWRIVLGDAYFKTLAYESARREYEKARTLGHPKATGRLEQLDKRLGK